MPAPVTLNAEQTLPADGSAGALAGRVWRPDAEGPAVVAVRAAGVFDISAAIPTMRDLCEAANPAASLRAASGERLGALDDSLANTPPDERDL
jgi:fumarylacetoacetate (FAA) hydrolase family protein